MKWKDINWGKVGMSSMVLLLFFHFLTLLTVLMLRVLQLEDALFVESLQAVGSFFRDSSMAAFLVTLMRYNFPKEALKSLQAMGQRGAADPWGSGMSGGYGGGYGPNLPVEEDYGYSGRVTPDDGGL